MSTTTEILVREHALILRGIDLLERAARCVTQHRALPLDASRTLLAFFDQFLDEHHHRKEETGLFPAMLDAGLPRRGGPIPVMLGEHDCGRQLVREMREALAEEGCRSPRFAELAGRFATTLREHIAKENGVLFPMSERFVPPEARAALAARWEEGGAAVEARWRDALAGVERALDPDAIHAT